MRGNMICPCVWQGADGGNRAWLSWKAAAACCGNKSCLLLRTLSQSIYSLALSVHVCFHRGVTLNWLHTRKIMFIWFFCPKTWMKKQILNTTFYLPCWAQATSAKNIHNLTQTANMDSKGPSETTEVNSISFLEKWFDSTQQLHVGFGVFFASWKELTKEPCAKI